MNTKTTFFLASFFALATTAAQATPTLDELISSIDGEFIYVTEDQRVNFEMSEPVSNDGILYSVLSGVDSEYDYTDTSSRTNFSLDAPQSADKVLEGVLQAIDSEYY